MKSASAGRKKFIVAIAITALAMFIVLGCVGGLAPAVVNYLLQPWDWAKRQLFTMILNTFHLTALSDWVDWSTQNFDKFAYFLVQLAQTFSLLAEESGLRMSQDTRKWLKHARNLAYVIEIPVNALYNYNHYTDGDARVSNPLWRWVLIIFFTALFTLIFEWVISFLFKMARGIIGVFMDNREEKGSSSSSTTYEAKAEPVRPSSPPPGAARPSGSHFA